MQRLIQLAVALVAALAPARRALAERRQGFRPGWLRAIALCTLFAFSACSATLTRRDDTFYEGTIVGSDADSVRIRTDSGSVKNVRRADIDDIDHPGNVLGTIGTLLGAIGEIQLDVILAQSHHQSEDYALAAEAALWLVTGVVLAIIGWSDYFGSRGAANHFGPARWGPGKAVLRSSPSRSEANHFGPARVVPVGVSPLPPPSLPPPSAPAASPQPPSLDPWE